MHTLRLVIVGGSRSFVPPAQKDSHYQAVLVVACSSCRQWYDFTPAGVQARTQLLPSSCQMHKDVDHPMLLFTTCWYIPYPYAYLYDSTFLLIYLSAFVVPRLVLELAVRAAARRDERPDVQQAGDPLRHDLDPHRGLAPRRRVGGGGGGVGIRAPVGQQRESAAIFARENLRRAVAELEDQLVYGAIDIVAALEETVNRTCTKPLRL